MSKEPTPTKIATDKIVAYLPKLNEFELGRISSEISRLRKAKKNKTQMKFDIPDSNTPATDGKEKDSTTN